MIVGKENQVLIVPGGGKSKVPTRNRATGFSVTRRSKEAGKGRGDVPRIASVKRARAVGRGRKSGNMEELQTARTKMLGRKGGGSKQKEVLDPSDGDLDQWNGLFK